MVVLITGTYVCGILRPASLPPWLWIMGLLLVPIGGAIVLLMSEDLEAGQPEFGVSRSKPTKTSKSPAREPSGTSNVTSRTAEK